jgi:hypothetical protein
MIDDDRKRDAINLAAKTLHETYFGAGTWISYGAEARGHARRALRRALSTLADQGFDLTPAAVPERRTEAPRVAELSRAP